MRDGLGITLQRALASPRMLWVVVTLALILGLPTLNVGLVGDDLAQFDFLRAHATGQATRPWWDMFNLVDGPRARTIGMRTSGRYPWWVDPDLRIVFFRPLAVATHHVDHRLWPQTLWLMHLHSVAWHMLSCALGWALARRLCASPASAGLTALVYVVAFSHTIPVMWLAHRNGLICASFGLASVLAHDLWRRDGHKLAGVLAVLAFGAALLSAEAGVVTFGLVLAHALVLDPGGWRQRALAVVPSAVTLVGWRVAYVAAGFGAHGSGAYIDPLGDPLGFVTHFIPRYAWLLASSVSAPLVVGIPASLWVATILLVAAVVVWFLLRARSKPAAFGLIATSLGCVPLTTSHPGDRLLVLTSFGMAMVFAELMVSWADDRAKPSERVAAGLVMVIHVLVAPVVGVLRSSSLDRRDTNGIAAVIGAELPNDGLERRGLILIHAPSFISAEYLPLARRARGLAAPNFVWLLHDGAVAPELTRVDGQTIELHAPLGWPGDELSGYWRSTTTAPFEVGDQVRTLDYVATVAEVDAGKATRVRFEFRTRLEHPSFVWARWDGADFAPIDPAAL